jgi:hypothetical protein
MSSDPYAKARRDGAKTYATKPSPPPTFNPPRIPKEFKTQSMELIRDSENDLPRYTPVEATGWKQTKQAAKWLALAGLLVTAGRSLIANDE